MYISYIKSNHQITMKLFIKKKKFLLVILDGQERRRIRYNLIFY